MANTALSVANTFVDLALRERRPISNMKLHKLMYFAQGHSLGLHGTRIIDEVPKAWQYGPVFPSVYHAFKNFGSSDITCLAKEYDWSRDRHVVAEPLFPGNDLDLILAVWDAYKERSAIELSNMSHVRGGPWDLAYHGQGSDEILDQDMRRFFHG